MHGHNAMIHIGAKARVVFTNNTTCIFGALAMRDGMITVGAESRVIFTYNYAIRVEQLGSTVQH